MQTSAITLFITLNILLFQHTMYQCHHTVLFFQMQISVITLFCTSAITLYFFFFNTQCTSAITLYSFTFLYQCHHTVPFLFQSHNVLVPSHCTFYLIFVSVPSHCTFSFSTHNVLVPSHCTSFANKCHHTFCTSAITLYFPFIINNTRCTSAITL